MGLWEFWKFLVRFCALLEVPQKCKKSHEELPKCTTSHKELPKMHKIFLAHA
jgi:hypothetical protein